jgi:hypothetical protein
VEGFQGRMGNSDNAAMQFILGENLGTRIDNESMKSLILNCRCGQRPTKWKIPKARWL